jgi:hypothetical protein
VCCLVLLAVKCGQYAAARCSGFWLLNFPWKCLIDFRALLPFFFTSFSTCASHCMELHPHLLSTYSSSFISQCNVTPSCTEYLSIQLLTPSLLVPQAQRMSALWAVMPHTSCPLGSVPTPWTSSLLTTQSPHNRQEGSTLRGSIS